MKSLKDYICESMFDEEDIETNVIDSEIINWIIKNYNHIKTSHLKISKKPNKDGKYVVDCNTNIYLNRTASPTSLTNNMFVWGEVKGDFNCDYCHSLTSLEGAPKEVGRDFNCSSCRNLTSLEGAPKEIGRDFVCYDCNSLTSLKGSLEKVGGRFDCSYCNSLTSLEGAPKIVKKSFDCSYCNSLTSLAGISKKIGGKIYCPGCAKNFTQEDIEKAQNS